MASIHKRTWTTPAGKERTGWQVDFHDRSGKRRRRLFRTKREADAFLVDARAADARGQYVHAPASITVQEATDRWLAYLDKLVTAGSIEPRTRDDRRSKIRHHVLNGNYGLGAERMADLSFKRVERFTLEAIGAGVTEGNLKRVVAAIRVFLSWSVDEGLIATSPLQGRRLTWSRQTRPQTDGDDVSVPSHEQMKKLLAKAVESYPDFALYLRFAALTGLRASEQRALDWSDVELEARRLTVRRRLDQDNRPGPPKSRAGRRTVPLAPKLAAQLKELWLQQGRPASGYVFANSQGGPLDHNNLSYRRWRPLLDKAGLDMRWHDLRHFAASSWLQAGVGIKEVQRRLGHADHGVTMAVYAHTFPEEGAGDELSGIENRLG